MAGVCGHREWRRGRTPEGAARPDLRGPEGLGKGGSGPDTDILTKLRRLLSEDRLWGDKSGGRGMTWEAKDDGGLGCRMLARDVEGLTVSISLPNSWSD